jgi:hypothetical protein
MIQLLHDKKTDVFHPKFFQAGDHENTDHYYLAEFPLYQFIVSKLYVVFGEHLALARLVNTMLLSVGVTALYYLARLFIEERFALLSGVLLSIFPSTLFWARAITPDIMGLSAFILSVTLLLYGQKKPKPHLWFISSALLGISVLTKPFYLGFFPLHLAIFSSYKKTTLASFIKYYLLPLFLFLSWRLWFLTFPIAAQTDPDISRLLHGSMGYIAYWKESSWPIRFLHEHFFGELLTPLGGILSIAGGMVMLIKKHQLTTLVIPWIATSLAITLIVSWGSREHDYYLLHWLPVSALLISYWCCYSIKRLRPLLNTKKYFLFGSIAFLTVITIYLLGIKPSFFYRARYLENETFYYGSIPEEYQAIQMILPQDAIIMLVPPYYTPFPLNMIKRFGFVHIPGWGTVCPPFEDFHKYLTEDIQKTKSTHLLFIRRESGTKTCPRTLYEEYLKNFNYKLIYQGYMFALYDVTK